MSNMPMLMAPVGPVAEAFVWDKRLVTAINGPVGSAKTSMCIRKCINIGIWQNRGPDGIRRARVGVVRDTYPQLRKTVLESWFTWFPKEMGQWNGESPFSHKISIYVPGVGRLELEMLFAAIGDKKVEDVMRGWELTALWLNEADLLARAVFRLGITRIGRYPSMMMGGCAWRGILMDLNAPDGDNWTYPLLWDGDMGLDAETQAELVAEFGPLFGIGFHRQPGGRSKYPLPENMHNLPKGYYQQMMIGQSADFIRRMIDNEVGAVRNGMPAYPEFIDRRHVPSEPIKAIRGLPIDLGVDGGLTPAAAMGQQMPNGQGRVLDELVRWIDAEQQQLDQVGPTEFGKELRRKLDLDYADNSVRHVWSDPAAIAGEGAAGEDRSWRQLFQQALGYPVRSSPVKRNSLEIRLDAVRGKMRRLVGDAEPEYLLSPICKFNRRGKNSGYVYRRTALSGGDDRYKNEPVKNQYSHLQDAEQYLVCGWAGTEAEFMGGLRLRPKQRQVVIERDYAILGD